MAELADYNGWTGKDRQKAFDLFRKAVSPQSVNAFQDHCDMCGMDRKEGPIGHHCEEYGPTLKQYNESMVPLCHRCHAMLHIRFRFPGIWSRYLLRLDRGKRHPPVVKMWDFYCEARRWQDYPAVIITGQNWFHKLPLEKYSGPKKQLAANWTGT